MHKIIRLITLCFCLSLTTSTFAQECFITVDGQLEALTLETSRTIDAAEEAFGLIPHYEPLLGTLIEVGYNCVSAYISNMYGDYAQSSVCTNGEWVDGIYWPGCDPISAICDMRVENQGIWDVICTCTESSECDEGYGCVDGACVEDQSPEFLSGPFWIGAWVGLSTDPTAPHIPESEHVVFWMYDDDGLACTGIYPEVSWMYRPIQVQEGEAVPVADWVVKTPRTWMWYVWIDAPTLAETILAPGLYEFKMQVTDCLGQVTDSAGFWGERYYIQIDP